MGIRATIYRALPSFFTEELPEVIPSDKIVLAYISFWTGIILKIRKPFIIGITGTAGKTTSTQMIAHVLSQENAKQYVGTVAKTIGNMNGDYGLRMSILNVRYYPDTWFLRIKLILLLPIYVLRRVLFEYPKVFVLEYGTYNAGHIHDLVKFARPNIAVLTNIGPAHLERLKTVEGVYLEKRALVQGVPENGLVVLGGGHEFVDRLIADAKAPVIVAEGRGLKLAEEITRNVCSFLNIPQQIVEDGLASYKPPKGRLSRFSADGITVIDDSYNANPISVKLGLDMLSAEQGRRVAVLGKMAELGDMSTFYHKEIGEYARSKSDLFIGVGQEAIDYEADHWFENAQECSDKIKALLLPNDIVLVKGSASAGMSPIVETFVQVKVAADRPVA
jgi:UDP-N-acetylmuramoyl-tripeptide--D-alanyl-D-alanine ligase